jgi:hypothetical protein
MTLSRILSFLIFIYFILLFFILISDTGLCTPVAQISMGVVGSVVLIAGMVGLILWYVYATIFSI